MNSVDSTIDLETTDCEKDLGNDVDSKLNFEQHVSRTTDKARSRCGMISRTMACKSPEVMIPLF